MRPILPPATSRRRRRVEVIVETERVITIRRRRTLLDSLAGIWAALMNRDHDAARERVGFRK